MLTPKEIVANNRWANANKKVNNSVKVLQKYGFGYSLSDGAIGNYKGLSKKDIKKVNIAAQTMGKFEATFVNTGKKTNNSGEKSSNIRPAHYEPSELADYEEVQEKSIIQSKSSMPLRATQQFISRTNYGPRLQSHPNKNVLNISTEDQQQWSNKTESLWRQDKELKSWDETRINNLDQLGHIAKKLYLEVGEYFAVIRTYLNDKTRPTNMSIQLYHPMQVQSPRFAYGSVAYRVKCANNYIVETSTTDYYQTIKKKGNYIEKGIEYSANGEEVAIFIAPTNFGSPYVRIPFKNKQGTTQVLHGFIQTDPGQKRGIPDGAYAWHEHMNIRDLYRYEMQSARLNSTISGSVTADSNAQHGGQQGGITDMGPEAGWLNPNNSANIPEYSEPGYSVREVNGGGYVLMNFTPGYQYKEHKTDRPNLNIPAFIEKNLEFTTPATYGASVVVVKQRFDNSYNASKGAIDLTWKQSIEFYLKQFSADWYKPLYDLWLNGKIANNKIIAPGWNDIETRIAWSVMSIITPAKPSLNPLQEAKAGEVKIGYAASNMEFEAQQQTGTSADENMDKLTYQKKKLRETIPKEVRELENNMEEITQDV